MNIQRNAFSPSLLGDWRTVSNVLPRISAASPKSLFVLLIFIMATVYSYNNDQWFLIATGREVLDSGVPFENPFALHDGMGIVVQQWLLAAEMYVVWDVFGMQGLAVQTGVLCCVFYLLLTRAVRCFSLEKSGPMIDPLSFSLAFATVLFYFSVRPSLLTAVILLIELLVLEHYKRGGRLGVLLVLPFCSLLHVNVHASFWWLGPVLASLYLVSPPRKTAAWFPRYGYRKLPVLFAALCMALASLANPYGLQGALYLAYSFGPAASMSIEELQPVQLMSPSGVVILLLVVLGVVLAIRQGRGKVDLQSSILFAGTLVLACANQRNGWLFTVSAALFVSPFLAFSGSGFPVPEKGRRYDDLARKALKAFPVVVFLMWASCALIVIALLSDSERWRVEDSSFTPIVAVEALNDEIPPENRDGVSVFNSFNNGGFLEWAGYPVFMDPRPELWSSAVTGCERDYAAEYAAFLRGEVSAGDLFDRYRFDYLVTEDGSAMDDWCQREDACAVLAEGEGYRLWKRR